MSISIAPAQMIAVVYQGLDSLRSAFTVDTSCSICCILLCMFVISAYKLSIFVSFCEVSLLSSWVLLFTDPVVTLVGYCLPVESGGEYSVRSQLAVTSSSFCHQLEESSLIISCVC